jgi:hypothetical protein
MNSVHLFCYCVAGALHNQLRSNARVVYVLLIDYLAQRVRLNAEYRIGYVQSMISCTPRCARPFLDSFGVLRIIDYTLNALCAITATAHLVPSRQSTNRTEHNMSNRTSESRALKPASSAGKDIKHVRASLRVQLWYLFFGNAPITWTGR